MESILEKFYNSGGRNNLNTFSQFGALQTNTLKAGGLSHSSKSPLPVRPMITAADSTMNTDLRKSSNITINTNFYNIPSQKDFLRPQNLAFNSSSDLIFHNPGQTQRRCNSEYNSLQNNIYAETKKNDTKMQMMEEKMKNLELKSQRLEVINDFFFDMFENNLVKEEINKQREKAAQMQKQKNKEEGLDSSSSESEFSNKKRKKRKNKKIKPTKLNLNDYDKEKNKKDEFDPQKYQEKTFQHTREVLENIKKNVGNYLFEEELKKNEQLQIMGEEINELRSKLINHMEKMQMQQKHNFEKVTFCLLNSADGEMEDLAFNLFRSKKSGGNTPKGSALHSRKNSISNKKTSHFNSRRGSIKKDNNTRRASIKKDNTRGSTRKNSARHESKKSTGTREIPNSGNILKAVGNNVIPEVNEDDGK
jgi:hypothetical protein